MWLKQTHADIKQKIIQPTEAAAYVDNLIYILYYIIYIQYIHIYMYIYIRMFIFRSIVCLTVYVCAYETLKLILIHIYQRNRRKENISIKAYIEAFKQHMTKIAYWTAFICLHSSFFNPFLCFLGYVILVLLN